MTAQYTQEFPSATITVTKAFRIKNEEEQSVMQMKDVIRRKRKELDLTQEQMAEYLGVSTPAVNKWESGATYPDLSRPRPGPAFKDRPEHADVLSRRPDP